MPIFVKRKKKKKKTFCSFLVDGANYFICKSLRNSKVSKCPLILNALQSFSAIPAANVGFPTFPQQPQFHSSVLPPRPHYTMQNTLLPPGISAPISQTNNQVASDLPFPQFIAPAPTNFVPSSIGPGATLSSSYTVSLRVLVMMSFLINFAPWSSLSILYLVLPYIASKFTWWYLEKIVWGDYSRDAKGYLAHFAHNINSEWMLRIWFWNSVVKRL